MLPSFKLLRQRLKNVIDNKYNQGYQTAGLATELDNLADSYDQLDSFAHRLAKLPMREDWTFHEPDTFEAILAAAELPAPDVLERYLAAVPSDSTERIDAAFKGSLCGCILGKPVEINPTLNALKIAGEKCAQWPLDDYISETFLDALGVRHDSWAETTRGNIRYVAPDDDINYSLTGMLLLEQAGLNFSSNDVRELWLQNLPAGITFGPERTLLAKATMESLNEQTPSAEQIHDWSERWNPGDEYCGAFIRMDAYGYACIGRPMLAAQLAYTDAAFTHRKTGLYASILIAVAMSLAPLYNDALALFKAALGFIPKRSRLHHIVADSIEQIAQADDWLQGYQRIHQRYGEYCHCQLYQEIGTLINSLHFSTSVSEAICKQVSQGNDTDSFGATCGSLAGLFYGPDANQAAWIEPFNDTLICSLASLQERSISALSSRMRQLPELIAQELAGQRQFPEKPQQQIDYGKGLIVPRQVGLQTNEA